MLSTRSMLVISGTVIALTVAFLMLVANHGSTLKRQAQRPTVRGGHTAAPAPSVPSVASVT